jgi:hypothetical protein
LRVTVFQFDLQPSNAKSFSPYSTAQITLNVCNQSHTSKEYNITGGMQSASSFDFIINATYHKAERMLKAGVIGSKGKSEFGGA